MTRSSFPDVIILGAGAAGLIAAGEAGRRGRRVLVLDHAAAMGEKIRISGGGHCNFTHLDARPEHYLSQNPSFPISALALFTPRDFLSRVEKAGIAWREKAPGQLFCQGASLQILDLLREGCREASAEILLDTRVASVARVGEAFVLESSRGRLAAPRLLVATGGKSIPKMGATGWGYQLAEQFGLGVIAPRPGLAPLVLGEGMPWGPGELAGVTVNARAATGKVACEGSLLFTHRGVSGPAILQLSSHWREGEEIRVDFAPGVELLALLLARGEPRLEVASLLARFLPGRLARCLARFADCKGRLADLSNARLRRLAAVVKEWRVVPVGSEGWRTAEVTVGGVDTRELSSRTMESRRVPGLFFAGEVVDVTGPLGGFNLQWAWSSGVAAGRAV